MGKLYEGNAKVVEVFTKELFDYQTKGLTTDEVGASFNLVFKVKPDDASFGEIDMDVIEISPRECTGKLAGRKQTEISLQQLARQGLVKDAKLESLGEVFESVGKTVSVYQKESVKGDKTYVNTYFSNGAAKLSSDELRKRLAMLTGKAVVSAPSSSANDDPFAS